MITHPEKILFPESDITKGELASYYESIAPFMVPHLRGRPVTLERYPSGIAAKGFIQKNVTKGFPAWLERVEVAGRAGSSFYPLVADARSLLWLSNQNSITPHVWTSRVPDLFHPDLCVFDLDPAREEPVVLRSATLAVHDVLAELGLPSWLKTSGSKGFHIVVPLDGTADFDTVSHFANGVGALLVERDPRHLTQQFLKADRDGRILIDTGRNRYGATFAAAYAVRARPAAPVSAPCSWQELERGLVEPGTFTLRGMPERMAKAGELWADLHAEPVSLVEPLRRLAELVPASAWDHAAAAARRKGKAKPK